MFDATKLNENGLTPEQEREVQEAYMLTEGYEISEEEISVARAMFDTPEKFLLLRKILQVFTLEERGISYKSPQALVEADPVKLQEYAVASAIDALADEKVRKALSRFYVLVRGINQESMTADFKKQNDEAVEEAKRTEEFEERQEEQNRPVGPNL